jgi:hypothetical protein
LKEQNEEPLLAATPQEAPEGKIKNLMREAFAAKFAKKRLDPLE